MTNKLFTKFIMSIEETSKDQEVRVAIMEARSELRDLDEELEKTVIPAREKEVRREELTTVLQGYEKDYGIRVIHVC